MILENEVNKRKFNLERVGQYLQNKNLQTAAKQNTHSEWSKLLDQNDCLKHSGVIYPHHKELSLVQEHSLLKQSIMELFAKPQSLIGEQFKFKFCMEIADISDSTELHVHHMNVESKNSSLFTATVSNELVYFIEFTSKSEFIKLAKFQFGDKPFLDNKFQNYDDLKIRHLQFYNESTISMLIDNTDGQRSSKCFVQFPIQHIQSRLLGIKISDYIDISQPLSTINLYDLLDPNLLRTLEVGDGHRISVSGSRKIASILSESQKRIRHYEMEVEDEDDEIDMSQTNNSLDISKESNPTVD